MSGWWWVPAGVVAALFVLAAYEGWQAAEEWLWRRDGDRLLCARRRAVRRDAELYRGLDSRGDGPTL